MVLAALAFLLVLPSVLPGAEEPLPAGDAPEPETARDGSAPPDDDAAGASGSPEEVADQIAAEDAALSGPDPAWQDSTVIARVGGDIVITAGDLSFAIDQGKGIDPTLAPDSLRRDVLRRVIHERILIAEAYRRGYERAGSVVNYATKLEEGLAARELRRRIYAGRLEVTEEELQELYDRYHYTLRVRHLSVDRRSLAEDLHQRLERGEDFGDLARQYSEDPKTGAAGGDMGEVRAGRMIIEFEDAVFKLEPGQLTGVIKGKGEHYKIFKLESKLRDRTPALSFETMRPGLQKRVRTRKGGAAHYAWQLALLEKYQVTVVEESYAVFAHRLRDNIATWEAARAVDRDSLPQLWVFTHWPPEEQKLELVRYRGGKLTIAEFNKSYRGMKFVPLPLWRDSDIELRQFVKGQAFEKVEALEIRAIRMERVPAIVQELRRRKESRMAEMIAAAAAVPESQVSEVDARAFYELHKHEHLKPEQARVRRIVVGTEEEAADILARLKGGADFAALAQKFSKDETTNWRGGETDFFGPGPGNMQGMADVALAHPPGTLIPPFQSRLGWEVVLVLEKQPPVPWPYAEVAASIKLRIASERSAANLDRLIAELRQGRTITIDERALAQVPVS
jgi:parvulin-like peptidyl-prolyl isomerase